jgi:hypothetical protein
MSDFRDSLPPDLAGLGDRLRRDRPELAPLELDRIKVNVMRRKNAAPKGGFMRARLTILGFLVVGIVMMGTGGALAVSGFSGGSAATSEYGPGGVKGVQATGTLGSNTCTESNSPTGSTANNCSPGQPAPVCSETGQNGNAAGTCAPSPTAQVSSGGNSLPFTGYAAIPVLLVGVALLGVGAVMRRRTRGQE